MSERYTAGPQNRWQEIRLFISSTFRDMHAERDYLIRFVFPRIREELLKRRLYFVDIDLRWGLTTEEDINGACRSIIDECRPLFLGILGGRYGYRPQNIPQSVSITEDEIDHALGNIKSSDYEGVYFVFRHEAGTLSVPEAYRAEYMEEEGSESAQKLKRLKERIRTSEIRYDDYPAVWSSETQGLTGLDEFGTKVYSYIMGFIEKHYETAGANGTDEEQEDSIEDIFISQRSNFFISDGLEPVFQTMEQVVKSEGENKVLLLTGQSGTGKSAFLCKLIENQKADKNLSVLHHFVGVTPHSGSLSGTLRRLCRLLGTQCASREPLPLELDKLVVHFQNLLARASQNARILLIIDGLNQLFEENNAHELLWLPQYIPQNVILILSSTPHPAVEAIEKRWPARIKVELEGLKPSAALLMVNHYLSRYQKHLTALQIELLLGKKESCIPLYLSTVIEELRMYGNYEGLSAFIGFLPGDTGSLLEWILTSRLMHSAEFTDDEGRRISSHLVPRYLSFIYISQSGLSELELAELLEPGSKRGNTAALTRQLRTFLLLHGELVNFYHDAIRTAVFNAFIAGSDVAVLHIELAGYFKAKADPAGDATWRCQEARPFSEILFHTLQSHDLKALDALAQSGFVEQYAKLAPTETVQREIKEMIRRLSGDSDDEHWDAVLRCARVFSSLADRSAKAGYDRAHPIELAIAEGRDEDVETLLSASSLGAQAPVLRCSAKILYEAAGRKQKADAIEMQSDEISALGSWPEIYNLFSAICSEKTNQNPSSPDGGESGLDGSPLSDSENEELPDIHDEDRKVKPKRHIPFWQVFSLLFTGRYRKILGVASYIGLAILLFLGFISVGLAGLVEAIKNWKTGIGFLKAVAEKGTYLIIGAIALGGPYLFVKFAYKKLMDLLENKSGNTLEALTRALKRAPLTKKGHIFLRITQYARKLRQSGIHAGGFTPRPVASLLANEISGLISNRKLRHAGLAVACSMNLDDNVRGSIAEMLRKQSAASLYQVVQYMLNHDRMFLDPYQILEFVFKIYGSDSPVSILMKVVSLQILKDRDKVIACLEQINKPILARCLVRFLPVMKTTKSAQRIKKVASVVRHELMPVPVVLNPRDLLEKVPLLVLSAPILFVVIGTCLVLLTNFSYYLVFLLSYPLFRLCKFIDRHERAAKEAEGSEGNLYWFNEDELQPSFSWKEAGKHGGISLMETAMANALINGNESPDYIIDSYPPQSVIKLWKALLMPGQVRNRGKLILPLMESGELLSKVIKRLPADKGTTRAMDLRGKNRQKRRVGPLAPKWAASLVYMIVSALIGFAAMGMLYLFFDKWMGLLLLRHGWLALVPVVFAGLMPYPKIRYLTLFLSPLLPQMVLNSWWPLDTFVEGELAIYTLIPALSLLLAHEVIMQWRCTRQIYPQKLKVFMGKAKSMLIGLAGSVLIGVAIVLAIYSAGANGDIGKEVETSDIATLKDYADAMRWDRSYEALYRRSLKYFVNYPWSFDPVELLEDNVYTYRHRVITLNSIANSLNTYGYASECMNCIERIFDYYGWAVAVPQAVDGEMKTVFKTADGSQVITSLLIVEVLKGKQGEALGLIEGDVIVSVNDRPVVYPEDLPVDWGKVKMVLTVRRIDKMLDFIVEPGDLGFTAWYVKSDYLKK